MNRRKFLRSAAGAVAATPLAGAVASGGQGEVGETAVQGRMQLGTQFGAAPSDDTLRAIAAFGVKQICSGFPAPESDEQWTVDGIDRLRDRMESFGINLVMLPLPLSSSYITRAENPAIMLGRSPERDREIDKICGMIRNCARAGIPAVKYNMTILGVVRTEPTCGRGGARYSTFNDAEAEAQHPPLTPAGDVSADEMWERITYFLKRVVPVANEYKIRIACHPHDPAMPLKEGYRGVHRVLGSVDGLKRFVSISASPYHGLNFCQGTVSEMLPNPGEQIYDVIRYFGERKKIFNVHFRNIRGRFLNFQETFPDNGSVNMLRAMRTYKEVGYEYMVMPDHAPAIEGDSGHQQAFAFEYGYIAAMLQTVQGEG
jgi:mannonate dehydratase